jgi:ribosomal protein S18 acetylase RimI-like enzyme
VKLLVTGAPGSGKTTLVQYAHKHGASYFYDPDEIAGLCEWREYATGKVVGPAESVKPTGGEQWYRTNGWYWSETKMSELLSSAPDVVICGSADNIFDFYPGFDKIVLLYKSRADLVSNLLQPGRAQANGKDPAHHGRILEWQEKLRKSLKSYDPIIIEKNDSAMAYRQIQQMLIHIAPASAADAQVVANFCQPIYAAIYPNDQYGMRPEHFCKEIFETPDTIQYFASLLESTPHQRAFIARDTNGTIVGTVSIERQTDYYKINCFYVALNRQGQGIGKRLTREALTFYDGILPIRVEVAQSSQKTIALYKHWGFKDMPELGIKLRHWPEWPEGLQNGYIFLQAKPGELHV